MGPIDSDVLGIGFFEESNGGFDAFPFFEGLFFIVDFLDLFGFEVVTLL